MTTNEKCTRVIAKATDKHTNKYDYSLVCYVNTHTNVDIICPVHGKIRQTPKGHLRGCGCPECGKLLAPIRKTKNTTWVVNESKSIHGDRYDYSLSDCKGCRTPITIICSKHGQFEQRPNDHLAGKGCWDCRNKFISRSQASTLEEFILSASQIHDNQHFEPVDVFGGVDAFNLTKKHDQIKNEYATHNNIHLIRISYMDYESINAILTEKLLNNCKEY